MMKSILIACRIVPVVCAVFFSVGDVLGGEKNHPPTNSFQKWEQDELAKLRKALVECDAQIRKLGANGAASQKDREMLVEQKQFREALLVKIKQAEDFLKESEAGMDTTAGVSNICPAHRVAMEVKKVPMEYGMPQPSDPGAAVIRAKEFPFARTIYAAGCVVGMYTEAWIYICPDCVKAEKAWYKEHRTP